jgi:hypothetical protein
MSDLATHDSQSVRLSIPQSPSEPMKKKPAKHGFFLSVVLRFLNHYVSNPGGGAGGVAWQ